MVVDHPEDVGKSRSDESDSVDPKGLDLGYLAFFVGTRLNEIVLSRLYAEGFHGIRHAHGYVFQHLLGGPRTVTELADLLDVSQQAASKSIAELVSLGYVEDGPQLDRRTRRVTLSERGHACIEAARAVRAKLEAKLAHDHGAAEVRRARALLAAILEELGGARAVKTRKVRAPR